jgi:HEAT repeat protein
VGAVLLVVVFVSSAAADKIDDLARALTQDPSYKVRVQAALVLGKLGDKRAVQSLVFALRNDTEESVRGVAATSLGKLADKSAANALLSATNDPSEFVRTQARKALEVMSSASASLPGPRAGARYYIAIGFDGIKGGNAAYGDVIRQALTKELGKLPTVTLSVGGQATSQVLAQKRLKGFVVDGSIQRLSSTRAAGQMQIDCDLRAFVATYPDKSIKMMTTEGASLQTGSGPSDEMAGKRDCLMAAVEAVRDDVSKFLQTVE